MWTLVVRTDAMDNAGPNDVARMLLGAVQKKVEGRSSVESSVRKSSQPRSSPPGCSAGSPRRRRRQGIVAEVPAHSANRLRDAHARLALPGGGEHGRLVRLVFNFEDFGQACHLAGLLMSV